MPFPRLIEHVSKKNVPDGVTFFIVEVMASDEEGEDVEVRDLIQGICYYRADLLPYSFRSLLSVASDFERY
jgi:hypothetical protein